MENALLKARWNLHCSVDAARCSLDACPSVACRGWKQNNAHLASCRDPKCDCLVPQRALEHLRTHGDPTCVMCEGVLEGAMRPPRLSTSYLHFLAPEDVAAHAASFAGAPPTPTPGERCGLCGEGANAYVRPDAECSTCARTIKRHDTFYERRGPQVGGFAPFNPHSCGGRCARVSSRFCSAIFPRCEEFAL